MAENIYLSKAEQQIFNIISKTEKSIITNKSIKACFPDINELKINKICSSLIKKGYFYKLKKGIYLINDIASENPSIKYAPKIGLELFRGYIAFSTALRIYDLLEYEPFTIFIATEKISRTARIGEYEFKAVAVGNKANGAINHNELIVSNLEKTFFDCFYKPQYAGGYETIVKALLDAKEINWKRLLDYFKKYASDSLCQRTGYILWLTNEKAEANIPEYVIDFFKTKIKTKSRLNPSNKNAGKYIKEWMIMDNVGEEKILGGIKWI